MIKVQAIGVANLKQLVEQLVRAGTLICPTNMDTRQKSTPTQIWGPTSAEIQVERKKIFGATQQTQLKKGIIVSQLINDEWSNQTEELISLQ